MLKNWLLLFYGSCWSLSKFMTGVTYKQLNLSDAYGYKGGDTSRVAYPTVESVRQEFYRTYPGLRSGGLWQFSWRNSYRW